MKSSPETQAARPGLAGPFFCFGGLGFGESCGIQALDILLHLMGQFVFVMLFISVVQGV